MPSFVWKPVHTAAAAVAALAVVGSGAGLAATRGASAEPPSVTPPAASGGSSSGASVPPSPTPRRSQAASTTDPLTGGRPSRNGVVAVKVENIAAARPQVGLSSADIVFAEEVEGAQTRLVAVYHSRFPRRLGPVRSARSTDAQLLPLFGRPALVYSGANRRVQAKIDRASIAPVQRTTRDQRRVAPHNVFVNLRSLAAAQRTRPAEPIGWVFDAHADVWREAARAVRPRSRVGHDHFRFDYAGGRYTVRWKGARYVDGDSGAVSRAENVVVLSVRNHPDGNRDVLGAASVMSDTVGRGRVTVYRDGRRISGTWERPAAGDEMRLRDGDGRDIPLRPGRTWVTLEG